MSQDSKHALGNCCQIVVVQDRVQSDIYYFSSFGIINREQFFYVIGKGAETEKRKSCKHKKAPQNGGG